MWWPPGAIANPDLAEKALFRRAGIVLCQSRQELIATASVFNYKELRGKNIAIITHAGGSAVMLTDSLSRGGLNVPELSGKNANELCTYLNKGSSVKNPIDFLATGTAEQLGIIIDFCEHKFDEIGFSTFFNILDIRFFSEKISNLLVLFRIK